MFRWENPSAFLILWVLPVILGLLIWFWARREKALAKSLNSRLLPFLLASRSLLKRKLKIILELLVVMLAVVAYARPQFGESTQKIKSQGVELVVALDVSNSMMAEDVKPSRLEQARNEVSRLLDRLSGDKVGLIAFAGSAVLLSPLTNDYSAVKMFMETMGPTSVTTQGTDFRSAVETAIGAFKRGGIDPDEGARVTRVMLIVTDGEVTQSDALAAAKKATEQGIRIFTLGVGTKAGGPIPDRDQFGSLRGYKKDRSGKVVLSVANEDELSKLAQAGGGAYYHADFSGQAVEAIKHDIDRMQKTEFESDQMANYDERFQPFLFAAVILSLIELLMSERKRAPQFWRGRFEVSQ